MRWSIFALITVSTALMIGSALAQGTDVPGDNNGDKIVSAEEVAAAEKLAQEGKLSADELQEIKHIHEKYPIAITDSANRTVMIYKPITSIIIQLTSAYEPIWVLGAQDKVIAVTTTAQEEYSWLPGIMEKAPVGAYKDIDVEKIIDLKPDIVLASVSSINTKGLDKQLEPSGIATIGVEFVELERFESELTNMARILEKDEKGEEFISWRNGYLTSIQNRTGEISPKIRVYGEWAHEKWATGGKTSAIQSVITAAGGENIIGDLDKYWIVLDPEAVMSKNPQVIFLACWSDMLGLTGYSIESPDKADAFLNDAYNRTGLKETDAAKDQRIFIIDAGGVLSSCRSFIATLDCAKRFYPEQFKDVNPEEVNREYFQNWIGVPYKGIWSYPQAI